MFNYMFTGMCVYLTGMCLYVTDKCVYGDSYVCICLYVCVYVTGVCICLQLCVYMFICMCICDRYMCICDSYLCICDRYVCICDRWTVRYNNSTHTVERLRKLGILAGMSGFMTIYPSVCGGAYSVCIVLLCENCMENLFFYFSILFCVTYILIWLY